MCVSTLPLCQFFHHCISVFPPVSVFPALRQYVCQDVYHRVSVSTIVCLYFHHCVSLCVCQSVSALVPLCQYFHNCVSVFPPVSVFPARCECFQHCQCQYCVSMSMQWCIQSVYCVMQCSKVPFTHTHTHTLRRGGYRACVCGQRVGAQYSRAQALSHTDPHSGREGPSPTTGARTHHRDVGGAPAETPTPRLQAAHRPKTSPHSTTMWAGLVGLGLLRGLVGWLGWFGLAL